MEKDKFTASASNMESDIEQARASNMEKDKANSPNKGKDIDVTGKLLARLRSEVNWLSSQQDGYEFYRSKCCIYRVSKRLQNENWKAYSPLLISIGPLHRDKTKRQAMENEKLRYYSKFTERHRMDIKKISDIMKSIQDQEGCLRACYSEKFEPVEKCDFTRMILLDAVFIIEFMKESINDKGPKNFEPRMIYDIRQDLVLLENQLPFFIIQEIYDRDNHARQDATYSSFHELVTAYFGNYTVSKGVKTYPSVKESRHFTDLLRNFMLKGASKLSNSLNSITLKYSAVRLRAAGVKFEFTDNKCLLNITFKKGVLKIPRLEIDYSFECLVRNIMALEHCLYESEAYICSYIKFMDHLIDSAEDVGLLVRKGIIIHRLGNDAAVSDMINKLCENNSDLYTYYDDTCQRMNAHYDNLFNHMKATLKLVYFPNVWRGTGTLAAAILLIFTFIQTITSVKSVF